MAVRIAVAQGGRVGCQCRLAVQHGCVGAGAAVTGRCGRARDTVDGCEAD